MTISIQFLGAARHVTGSKHLLRINDKAVLLECGMVQGPRKIANKLNTQLPLDASEIDAVVLSHAHIDHSGSLPRLVKMGYEGPIYCTEATADLIEVLLMDSAHLQASDAKYLSRRGDHFEPAYDAADVEKTLQLVRSKRYHQRFEVLEGIEVEYVDAGHILGSAQVVVDIKDGTGDAVRVCFTGDHGRENMPILRDPERLPECDFLISESTYGNRLHGERHNVEKELAGIINEEMENGGRIIIPAFSLGRTQTILLFLHNLVKSGKIPKQPIFVDSPMATKATKITSRYQHVFDEQAQEMFKNGNPFFDGVRYVADVDESKSLNNLRQGIIISASGMCEGGRVLHHLKRSVSNPNDCVLMAGYQAEGTLGRKLFNKYPHVNIYGERYAVRCNVRGIGGLSAHADWEELVRSLRHLNKSTKSVFIVHGEEDPALIYADHLRDAGFKNVEVPVYRQKFVLKK